MKPSVDSSSGNGCMLLNIVNGIDIKTNKTIISILNEIQSDFLIQEKIICHDSIRKIYPNSVNTFRVITYYWNGKFNVMPSILRIGQGGSYVDNAHAGGMFIAIDNSGELHETAFTEFNKKYIKHPDSGVVFNKYSIPLFKFVIQDALRMAEMVPWIGCINWDFTIDYTGTTVLIEANMRYGSIWMAEMAHGIGAFGDKTADILRWLKALRKLSYSKRTSTIIRKRKDFK